MGDVEGEVTHTIAIYEQVSLVTESCAHILAPRRLG